ncbi:MAG: DUF547 domain-containing protein [Sedimentisphaerales bacterium]|nr:DUF547 domain-containing protein [Sedimentisphaerales bacterium]
MAKYLVILTATLTISVFVTGCNEVESEYPELIEPVYLDNEPVETKSDDAMSSDAIAGQLEPDEVGTIGFQLDNIGTVVEVNEPGQMEIKTNEPEQMKIKIDEPAPVVSDANIMPVGETGKTEVNIAEPNEIHVIEPVDSAAFFHDKFSDVLNDVVDDKGLVHYKKLRRQRLKLKALIREFDTLNPDEYKSWTKENKIAFWLNAYNIQMLRIITENYPIQSSRILRLYPGWGPDSILHIKGIWTDYKFLVMDEEFTLSEIDKRIFRKEFDDPRIFFAVFRGGLSGPPLRDEAYYGHRLNEQLDDQVKKFLSSPLAFNVDADKQRVYLSSLFQVSSYGREFLSKFAVDKKFKDQEPTTRAVLNFITQYVSRDIVSFLEVGNYSVKYIKYDWTINDGF